MTPLKEQSNEELSFYDRAQTSRNRTDIMAKEEKDCQTATFFPHHFYLYRVRCHTLLHQKSTLHRI
jgi:hypothetical protein